jgi:hypothetical protein
LGAESLVYVIEFGLEVLVAEGHSSKEIAVADVRQ